MKWSLHAAAVVALLVVASGPSGAQTCSDVTCENLPEAACTALGMTIELTDYIPAAPSNSGMATYVYEVCSPALGVCTGGLGLREGEACSGNAFCQSKGPDDDPGAACTRECAVDEFRGLSHFDVFFPELGAECMSAENEITGTCACKTGSSGSCSVRPGVVVGDGSCYESDTPVAKCDSTNLAPGDCVVMTLNIAGETTAPGLGATVLGDKASGTCEETCLAGPACENCFEPGTGGFCLTRTIGFWGTHPWVTNNYATDIAPVTVCGKPLHCDGAANATTNPACKALKCDSAIEALCSNPAELPKNGDYVTMVRQLTAAKLNLAATANLVEGTPDDACGGFEYQSKSIHEWIATCEGLCGANQATISGSGCIQALDTFNNSLDSGFLDTPEPFNHPGIDDFGHTSGADPNACQLAKGSGKKENLVIGKNSCS